jgi:dCMP deaminase
MTDKTDTFPEMPYSIGGPVGPSTHKAYPDAIQRPSWDQYFMQVAYATAKRSTCPRRAVGAVIVQEGRIIATGYNGAPSGTSHCPSTNPAGHPSCMRHGHCTRTVHAELNALLSCAAAGVRATGALIYSTTFPCPACMAAIINAGLKEVRCHDSYSRMGESAQLAAQADLTVTQIDP